MRLAKARVVLLGLYALVPPSMAQPTFNSGGYMLPHCKKLIEMDAAPGVWEGQCAGVIDGFMFLGDVLPKDLRFCPLMGFRQ